MLSHITGVDGISCVVDGEMYLVSSDHPKYVGIQKAIDNGDESDFLKLYSQKQHLEDILSSSYVAGHNIEIKNGMVYYNEEPLHMSLTRRILDLHSQRSPINHLIMFLHNLMENSSYSSKEQLYTYAEKNHMPITEDGYLLAYKYVTDDYKSCHVSPDGTHMDHSIGAIPSMPRNEVDDDPANHCSSGLHAGSFQFVHPDTRASKVMIIKINPRDVVSVPNDHSCQKIRACEYEVIGEYKKELTKSYYDSSGEEHDEDLWDDADDYNQDVWDEVDDFMNVDDILEGQKITFTYTKEDGSESDRIITVDDVRDKIIKGYITATETFRTFSKKGMSQITRL